MRSLQEHDELLWRAIESGELDESLAIDAELTSAFAAYRRLESLFAGLRAPAPPSSPLPRLSQIGRYELHDVIGRGAFGTVYLATDPQLDRSVAIKVRHAQSFPSEQDAGRFLDEAKLAARLKHPGIVTIHDAGQDQGFCFIVMEYVKGDTLLEASRQTKRSFEWIRSILAEVADALAYAHANGFIHRDLKPANILIDAGGHPHIADFGLAISEDIQHFHAGQVAGTPAYMSPEQVRGETQWLDGRTDIWSLGVILYELLTGRRPFLGSDVASCLDEIQNRAPKPPRQIDDTIPEAVQEVCLRCLEKDPTRRFSSAADVANALRSIRANHDPAIPAPARTPIRRRGAVWLTFGLLFLSLATALAVWLNRPPPIDPPSPLPPPTGRQPGLDPKFSSDHPKIAGLLGFVYEEALEGASPDAWIQVEQKKTTEPNPPWRPLDNGSHLSTDDRYRIILRAPEPTYFYVFQIDTRGQVDWVFPKNPTSTYSSGSNPAFANTTVKVPEGDGNNFFLDEHTGIEHVYVVATRRRWTALEVKLADSLREPQTVVKPLASVEKPLGRGDRGIGGITTDNSDEHARITGVDGIIAKEVWFHHVSPRISSQL